MTTTTRRVALVAWISLAIFTTGSVLADLILPVGVAVLLLLVAMWPGLSCWSCTTAGCHNGGASCSAGLRSAY